MCLSRSLFKLFVPVVLSGAFLLWSGCETEVDPILGADGPFSLYGFLNPTADTQAIRIFEVTDRIQPDTATVGIEAEISSTDLETGERHVWRDSLLSLPGEVRRLAFWSDFRPEYGHTYRIEAKRLSDGATSWAEVTVPPLINLEEDLFVEPGEDLRVYADGVPPSILHLQAVYSVLNQIPLVTVQPNPPPQVVFASVRVPLENEPTPTADGLLFEIDLRQHAGEYLKPYYVINQILPRRHISLRNVELQMIVANAEWSPPGGVFDPDLLVEPGAMENVQNGFGFIGAGYFTSVRWRPEPAVNLEAGLSECWPAAGLDCVAPEGVDPWPPANPCDANPYTTACGYPPALLQAMEN